MLLALIALLAAPVSSPALASLSPRALSQGTVGVQFGFPAGGSTPVGFGSSTVGVTYFVADNLAARIDFGLAAVLSPSGTPALFNIGVGLRMYQFRRDNVAVFLQPGATLGREILVGAALGGATDATVLIGFSFGLGAEYFFAEHFSVGGVLGAGLNFRNIGGPANSSVQTSLSTSTSGLFASLYF